MRDLEKGTFGQGSPDGEAGGKPKLNIRNTLTKWFVDCMLVGAILNTLAFFVIMGFLKGQSFVMIAQTIRTVSGESVR